MAARIEYPDDWFIAWHSPKGDRRLDDRVRDRVPALSRERTKEAFAAGRVTLSGKKAEPGERAGGRVEVSVPQDDAGAWAAGGRAGEGFFVLYGTRTCSSSTSRRACSPCRPTRAATTACSNGFPTW